MRIQKIVQAGLTAVAGTMLTVAPAFAAVNGTSLVNSGDKVFVESETLNLNKVEVENSNKAYVDQSVYAESNTGHNEASGNIGLGGFGGSIVTGGASINTALGVVANKNVTSVEGMSAGAANLTDVVNTGDKVAVDTDAVSINKVDVENNNFADVDQSAWLKATTGKNDANDNIGGGAIHTGPAAVSTSMNAKLNSNVTGIEGGWGGSGQSGLLNHTSATNTGDKLYLDTATKNLNFVEVENFNFADVAQLVHAKSTTGANDANNNIGGGEVVTSGAGITTGASVDANSNLTGITDWMGLVGSGANLSDIVNTGDKVAVDAELENKNEVDVDSHNAVYSYQDVWERSLSGYNASSYNIGGGVVHSGIAGIGTGAHLLGNHNATAIGWMGGFLGLLSM